MAVESTTVLRLPFPFVVISCCQTGGMMVVNSTLFVLPLMLFQEIRRSLFVTVICTESSEMST